MARGRGNGGLTGEPHRPDLDWDGQASEEQPNARHTRAAPAFVPGHRSAIGRAGGLGFRIDRHRGRARRARRAAPPDRPAGGAPRRALGHGLPADRHRLAGGGARRTSRAGRGRARTRSRRAARQDPRGAGGGRPPCRCARAQPRPARADDRRPRRAPLALGAKRRPGRARMRQLAFAAAARDPRDAVRLVAGQALQRLPVSRGARRGAPRTETR